MADIGIIAKKVGMRSIYDNGRVVPVTALKIQDCEVIGTRTIEKDGYSAVILGAFNRTSKNLRKPQITDYDKKKIQYKRVVKEFRVEPDKVKEISTKLDGNIFEVGSKVSVKGRRIGKGFAGGMKRHGFSGNNASHGATKSHRSLGSVNLLGAGRVYPGTKMPGRINNRFTTIRSLKVMKVQSDEVLIKGSVPGPNNSIVVIKKCSY